MFSTFSLAIVCDRCTHSDARGREVEHSKIECCSSISVLNADVSIGGGKKEFHMRRLVTHHGPVQWSQPFIILTAIIVYVKLI